MLSATFVFKSPAVPVVVAIITSFISSCMLMGCNSNRTNDETNSANQMNALNLTSEWDKTFPKSDKVNHSKITFHNRYGITLAADLYPPVNASGNRSELSKNSLPDCMPNSLPKEVSLPSLLIPHIPEKAEENRAMWLLPILTRKILAQPLIA